MMTAPDAATAVGYGDKPPARQLRLISWRPLAKGSLRGFCTIELLPLGLKNIDCPVLLSHGRAWCALPAKVQVENTGRQKPTRRANRFMSRCCNGATANSATALAWR
jgi:hypothetical protein